MLPRPQLWPFALIACLPGCLGLDKEFPDRRLYVLHAPAGEATTSPGAPTLQVRPFDAAPACAARGLVYRRGESQFEADFYHEFFVPPDQLVTDQVLHWLGASGVFAAVRQPGSIVAPDLVLDGRVTALHGDFRAAPHAVLEIQVFLTRLTPDGASLLLQRDYREEVPLDRQRPADLVSGWNAGLTQVLMRLEQDLRDTLTGGPG